MKAWPFDLNAVAVLYLLIADGERLSLCFGIFWLHAVTIWVCLSQRNNIWRHALDQNFIPWNAHAYTPTPAQLLARGGLLSQLDLSAKVVIIEMK
jgi:hypothetical protein